MLELNTVRSNYRLLFAIVAVPVVLFVFGRQSELLYGIASVAIVWTFVRIAMRIQRELKNTDSDDVEAHFKRQMNIIMVFVITGIVSAIHAILRFHLDSKLVSGLAIAVMAATYIWGLWNLITGYLRLPSRAS